MGVASLLRRLPGRQALRTFAFRTGAIKWWWRYRHLIDGSYREVPGSTGHTDPHREQLWSLIAPFAPRSLVEIGCGDGANLVHFAQEAPALALSAIDVNPLALRIAEQRVRGAGGTTGEFRHGSADQLPFADAAFDVALSDAVFMYLPPAKALAALREMRRVARRAVVVHTFADDALAEGAVIGGNWVHAFERLARTAIAGATLTRHQSALVTSGQWREFGAAYIATW